MSPDLFCLFAYLGIELIANESRKTKIEHTKHILSNRLREVFAICATLLMLIVVGLYIVYVLVVLRPLKSIDKDRVSQNFRRLVL